MLGFLLTAALLATPAIARKRPPPATGTQPVHPNENLSADDVRKNVDAYLGSIDTPIGPDQWKTLGPRAIPILEQIAMNQDELPTRRAKAIDGLAALGDRRAPTLLEHIANRDGEKINVRFAAVRGLAQMTPLDRAGQVLQPILESARDSRVRALAAEQIAIRTRGKSCDLVRERLDRESDAGRRQYGRARKQCGIE